MNYALAAIAVLFLAYLTLRTERKIMPILDDYIASQQAYNTEIVADLGTIQTTVQGLNTQIATLTAQLAGAGLTQAQTDALAALTTAGQALEAQADALAGKEPPAPPAAPAATS